jgi:hypothetical protein
VLYGRVVTVEFGLFVWSDYGMDYLLLLPSRVEQLVDDAIEIIEHGIGIFVHGC